jgi:hypothetical protein
MTVSSAGAMMGRLPEEPGPERRCSEYTGSFRKYSARGGVCAKHCKHDAMKHVLPRLVRPFM